MEFTAQLDVDVVALEAEDEVTCLVSLTAPVPEEIADRPGGLAIAVLIPVLMVDCSVYLANAFTL